eukprot:10377044-Alexandrium_andersonii.AAC.1
MEGCCLSGVGLRRDEPGELPFAPKRDRDPPPTRGLEGGDDFGIAPRRQRWLQTSATGPGGLQRRRGL